MNYLQDLILLKIFQYVEVDIDKISLLLTCKRIFGNRAKIEFRLLGCLLNLEQMDEHCRLESFKSSIIRSLKYKLSVKQFEKERSDAYTRKLELFDSLIGLDSTTSTNTTNVAFKPPLEVSDLLALSSDPAFQSSPSAARNYQKSFRALRDLKKRVNDLEGGNSSSNRSNESSQFSKILELDDAINPKSTSFVVDDESFSRVPPGTTHLTFNSKFERFISPSSIPATLTHLTFGHQYNHVILPGTIPTSVTNLTFGYYYDRPIRAGVIPESVTTLTMGFSYNHTALVLPASLTSLTLKSEYSQLIAPGWLPAGLKKLRLLHTFNNRNDQLQVASLPAGLEYLELQPSYNLAFAPGILSNTSLKQLVLGDDYSHPLLYLPPTLESLNLNNANFNNNTNDKNNKNKLIIPFKSLYHLTTIHLRKQIIRIRYLDNNNVFVLNQQFMGGFISNTENFNFVDIAKSLESRYQQQSK